MKRLGIVVSHPIQYYSPLFRYLAKSIDLVVFYCHNPSEEEIGNDGFGIKFKWDQDLLSGYKYVFLNNISKTPSLSAFNGCDTPDIGQKFKEHNITHVVIIGWYLKSHIQALLQAKKLGIKTAVRGDSQLNPNEPLYKYLVKRIFYRFLIRKYDALLYVGKRNKEYLLKYGAKESQLIFSPHAVDQEFWRREIKEHNNSENKIIFIWIAKFIPLKRPFDAIDAFKVIYKKNPNTELWMIGSGELMNKCVEITKDTEYIKLLGFKNQNELRSLLGEAHCLLLTSDSETWGLVVNEAFCMGIPAIVSTVCGVSADLIEEGKTGYTYTVGDRDELAKKTSEVCQKLNNPNYFRKAILDKNMIYSYEQNEIAFKHFLSI